MWISRCRPQRRKIAAGHSNIQGSLDKEVSNLLHTKLQTLNIISVDELNVCPPCMPLSDVPSRKRVEYAIRGMANRPNVLLVDFLEALATKTFRISNLPTETTLPCVEESGRTAARKHEGNAQYKPQGRKNHDICLAAHTGKVLFKVNGRTSQR